MNRDVTDLTCPLVLQTSMAWMYDSDFMTWDCDSYNPNALNPYATMMVGRYVTIEVRLLAAHGEASLAGRAVQDSQTSPAGDLRHCARGEELWGVRTCACRPAHGDLPPLLHPSGGGSPAP